ncbi:tripartite tricarboxylate transporter TctB family protein [Sinorhizobium meliloti]|nr:tripartite tricarboxylate transporter TctB family protein [Sinorhizobium meliloti]
MTRLSKDVVSGLLLIVIAAIYIWQASFQEIGTASEMGPGYFPMAISILIGLLGIAILANGVRRNVPLSGPVAWRGAVSITLAVVAFAAMLRPFGFVPATAFATFLSTLAAPPFRWKFSVLATFVITALCWLIFVVGIRISVPSFGPVFLGK